MKPRFVILSATIFFLGAILCTAVGKEDTKAGNSEAPFVIMYGKGDSMLPTIKPGQPLKLVYKPYKEVKLGDICWYRSKVLHELGEVAPSNVAHRTVKKNLWPRGWVMRGDNWQTNTASDPELMTSENYVCVIVPLPMEMPNPYGIENGK